MERVGIFGGTFDPVHLGHIRAAQGVKEQFGLQRILLVPAATPPHKHRKDMASSRDRLEMVRLAASACQDFDVSDIEIRRKGPSYTIDTVEAFSERRTGDATFFLIMGIDAFEEIDTWKSFPSLFRRISLIVISRPGIDREAGSLPSAVETLLHAHISAGYRFQAETSAFSDPDFLPVYICRVAPVAVSSTHIRENIRAGRSIRGMVPADVENYILSRELYR